MPDPCSAESLPPGMTAARQHELTTAAAYSYLEIHFGIGAETRALACHHRSVRKQGGEGGLRVHVRSAVTSIRSGTLALCSGSAKLELSSCLEGGAADVGSPFETGAAPLAIYDLQPQQRHVPAGVAPRREVRLPVTARARRWPATGRPLAGHSGP